MYNISSLQNILDIIKNSIYPSSGSCSRIQNPEPKIVKNLPNPETVRKINRVYDKADRITMGYTCNHIIAYSGCQGEIEDNFWKIVKQNPLEFFKEDKLDEDNIRETYKAEARSLGVRIY